MKQKDSSQRAGSLWTIDSDKIPNKPLIVSLVRSIGITVYQTPRDSRVFLRNLFVLLKPDCPGRLLIFLALSSVAAGTEIFLAQYHSTHDLVLHFHRAKFIRQFPNLAPIVVSHFLVSFVQRLIIFWVGMKPLDNSYGIYILPFERTQYDISHLRWWRAGEEAILEEFAL